MLKRAGIAFAAASIAWFAWTGAAHAQSLGVGSLVSVAPPAPVAVPTDPPTTVAGDAASGALSGVVVPISAAVGNATNDAVAPRNSDSFAGHEAPVVAGAEYKAFEDLVNDASTGGGWHGPAATTDAFSATGVDGGVPGFTTFGVPSLLLG